MFCIICECKKIHFSQACAFVRRHALSITASETRRVCAVRACLQTVSVNVCDCFGDGV